MRFYVTTVKRVVIFSTDSKRKAFQEAIAASGTQDLIVHDIMAEAGKVDSWFVKSASVIVPRSRATPL